MRAAYRPDQARDTSASGMQNRFWLQKVANGSRGERFIIHVEANSDKSADSSMPMSACDAKTALHKLGMPDAVIESMFDRARASSQN